MKVVSILFLVKNDDCIRELNHSFTNLQIALRTSNISVVISRFPSFLPIQLLTASTTSHNRANVHLQFSLMINEKLKYVESLMIVPIVGICIVWRMILVHCSYAAKCKRECKVDRIWVVDSVIQNETKSENIQGKLIYMERVIFIFLVHVL